jgi:hypothetical protein
MKQVLYPSLYQLNTRVWLTSLSKTLGRLVLLDDIPDVELDRPPFYEIKKHSVRLKDLLSSSYIREGNDLPERGLYPDMQPCSYHVFDLEVNQ